MRIFVTGATGCLGYHFVNVAVEQGHEILCLRRSTSKSLFDPTVEGKIQWVTNDDKMKETVDVFNPDILFHAAWGGVRGAGRDSVEIQTVNLQMSRVLFTLYPYKQIISIGSQAEYGYYDNIISEDYPLHPQMEYAKAKVQCSKELQEYCEANDIEWQWIRIFTVFGEMQTGGLIKIAIEKCLNGEKYFPTTKGEQQYSYLYSSDFAHAVCNMLGSKGKSGVYNLSQPCGLHSNRDVLETVKRLTTSSINLDFGAIPYPDGQVMLMDGRVDRFEQAFGHIPYTNFEKALVNTIDSFRK